MDDLRTFLSGGLGAEIDDGAPISFLIRRVGQAADSVRHKGAKRPTRARASKPSKAAGKPSKRTKRSASGGALGRRQGRTQTAPNPTTPSTSPQLLTVPAGLMSRYDRKELYNKVWKVPMRLLAKEFGISDVALAKTCKKLKIPVPGRGYWAKMAADQPVGAQPRLPKVQIS